MWGREKGKNGREMISERERGEEGGGREKKGKEKERKEEEKRGNMREQKEDKRNDCSSLVVSKLV